jgi:UDPglucose 6-dehydrogenase
MRLAVIGTGYVGLVTGTCFAEMGNEVVCVDIDTEKLARLKSGVLPIFEPGLVVLFERGLREGRLTFTDSLDEAIPDADVVFLTLPTPPDEDGSADLSHVLSATKEIAKRLDGYTVIVSKSTVPVGTSRKLVSIVNENKPTAATFDVASNPEFLREGVAVDDFMKPDRVIVGTSSEKASDLLTKLYEPFVRSGNPILIMDEASAELAKYAANAFLATKISFMNEIANLCDVVGANVDDIRRGIGADERIGRQFLFAGIGYGGSCFPKDVAALGRMAEDSLYDFKILNAVTAVNRAQRVQLVDRLLRYFDHDLSNRHIAVWGLAFKPNTDDIREAPALTVIEHLLEHGASVTAFDPVAIENVRAEIGDRIAYAADPYAVLKEVDALAICTEWSEFRRPKFETMLEAMANPAIFDGRNLFDPAEMKELGFYYESIGRPSGQLPKHAGSVRAGSDG